MDTITRVTLLLAALCVAGCPGSEPGPMPAADVDARNPTADTDAWMGRWLGPEGTYLEIAGANGIYDVVVKDLDSARTFKGRRVGEHIKFERDSITESLAPGDGNGTGMKWLAGKKICLVIRPGEGYCRD